MPHYQDCFNMEKLKKNKSLLKKLMSFGARDKAKEAKPEPMLDKEKIKKFKLKKDK